MSTVLTFTPDGLGHGLYTEAFDLGQIGRLSVRRATRIEFDEKTQYWRVYLARGKKALFNSPSRQTCLNWERDYFNHHQPTREDP